MRALRVDKMTLAALEATLRLAMDAEHGRERIPLWAMIAAPLSGLMARAESLAKIMRADLGLTVAAVASEAYIGGGSAPIRPIPSAAVAVSPPFPRPLHEASEAVLADALRMGDPAVVSRVRKGAVILDLRTIPREQEGQLLDAIRKVWQDSDTPAPARPARDVPGHPIAEAGNGDESTRPRFQA
jgi:L-seryl-tRNA(Ser) seleniumtransferase